MDKLNFVRSGNAWKVVLLYFLCFLLAALLWNAIIGVCFYQSDLISEESPIGRHMNPNSRIIHSDEGYFSDITDNNGLNNDPTEFSGREVLLVLGDSHTEATEVPRSDNFCSKVRKKLKPGVIVYNAGASGNSMANYIYYGRSLRQFFNPDVILIQVTQSDFTSDATNPGHPCHIQKTGNNFVIAAGKQISFSKAITWAVTHVPLLPYAYRKAKGFLNNWKSDRAPFLPHARISDSITPDDPAIESLVSWEIGQLKDCYGDKVVILYLPETPRPGKNNTIVWDDPDPVRRIVENECRRQGISYVYTGEAFERLLKEHNQFPRGFPNSVIGKGHLNSQGHEVVASVLMEVLQAKYPELFPYSIFDQHLDMELSQKE
jgi:lysophospholipase L1-like esterase